MCAYRAGVELRVEAEGDRENIHRTGSPNISTANRLSPSSVNLPLISLLISLKSKAIIKRIICFWMKRMRSKVK